MSEFQTVANVGDIPEGEGRCFQVKQTMVAVFLAADEYTAVSDTCPHMGASLATGYVEEGGVTCPWHAWRFCVKDGTWLDNPKSPLALDTYQVRVEGNEIQVSVPDKRPSSSADTGVDDV